MDTSTLPLTCRSGLSTWVLLDTTAAWQVSQPKLVCHRCPELWVAAGWQLVQLKGAPGTKFGADPLARPVP